MDRALTREDVESAIKTRGADVYAGFLLRHIRADMAVLDCGCGEGTITLGLAKAVPEGRVFGIDFEQCGLSAARRAAGVLGLDNLSCIPGMVGVCPFCDAEFDAVLCHSMLETVDDPMNLILELRRVTKHAGLVGAASVDYGGLILGGQKTAGPQRFYEIRHHLWRSARIAEPNMARRCAAFLGRRNSIASKRTPITSATGHQSRRRKLTSWLTTPARHCSNSGDTHPFHLHRHTFVVTKLGDKRP